MAAAPGRTPAELVAAAGDGDPRAIGRLLSLVEGGGPGLGAVMALLGPPLPEVHVVGVTGAAGVGKSTVISALVAAYREQGLRVGVLAVGPSSPVTGGALLGDRVRMAQHTLDDGVFIRSLGARGHPGGLSATTPQALAVLAAAGCAVILLETVGVGPAEVDVALLADSTVVLVAPGAGDGAQAAAAGIGEVADVLVVNQADRDGADAAARELRRMLSLSPRGEGDWRTPVIRAVASRLEGLPEVFDALSAHQRWLAGSGEGSRRRAARATGAGRLPELAAHPEGGRFRETWRAGTSVTTARGERATATAITYVLEPGESSAWHRVRGSAELWVHQSGGVLELQLGGRGDAPVAGETIRVGPGGQHLVEPDEWQAAVPAAQAVQVVCVVSPGFDYGDFELAPRA